MTSPQTIQDIKDRIDTAQIDVDKWRRSYREIEKTGSAQDLEIAKQMGGNARARLAAAKAELEAQNDL